MAVLQTRHEIEFGFNKSRVNLATGRMLDAIVADWKGKPARFEVIGHADTVGNNRYNDRLSTARAQNIRNALIARGIAPDRVTARGVGQTDLAVPTPDETRLRANRRVVISIKPAK
ncbi:MAG: OmpA family protein [Alphaproteobacteria bacterium]